MTVIVWEEMSTLATRPAAPPCTVAPNSMVASGNCHENSLFHAINPNYARYHAIFVFLNGA